MFCVVVVVSRISLCFMCVCLVKGLAGYIRFAGNIFLKNKPGFGQLDAE